MNQLRIILTGDISFANLESFTFGARIKSLFQSADLVVGNLEALLTHSEEKRKLHPYHLKSSPDHIKLLAPFNAFSLANNHVLDYGRKGLQDTMQILKDSNKQFFGAGFTRSQAEKPLLVTISGIKLAFFGVSRFANPNLLRSYGTASDRSKTIREQIANLKHQGYFIIVIPHWSYEYVPFPSPLDRSVAKRLIGSGADVIVGSHPHEMQGIETIKGKTVFYSLGNFVFSSKDFSNKANWKLYDSFVVELNIHADHSYSYQLLPYQTTDTTVELHLGSDEQKVKDYVDSISESFTIQDKQYKTLFYESIRKMRASKAIKSAAATKPTNLKSQIRSLAIRIKYMNRQDFKLALYLNVTRRFFKKKQSI